MNVSQSEYVRVLVANQRDQGTIEVECSTFLGDKAAEFFDWCVFDLSSDAIVSVYAMMLIGYGEF